MGGGGIYAGPVIPDSSWSLVRKNDALQPFQEEERADI